MCYNGLRRASVSRAGEFGGFELGFSGLWCSWRSPSLAPSLCWSVRFGGVRTISRSGSGFWAGGVPVCLEGLVEIWGFGGNPETRPSM